MINNGRIIASGTDGSILSEAETRCQKINLQGRTILPGLIDAHIHLQAYGLGLQKVECETQTLDECLQRVAQKAKKVLAGEWILGHGWNQNQWLEGFGTSAMLDQAAPANPVYLTAKSLHAGWANSAALKLAGIEATTPDPPGGQIQRDPAGQPTGILLESAMTLLEGAIPKPTKGEIQVALLNSQAVLLQMGITAVHDFDQRDCFIALQQLDLQAKLKIRVQKGIPLNLLPHALALGLRQGMGSQHLFIGPVKLFADGALGPRTAYMLTPYEHEHTYCGFSLLNEVQIIEYGKQAVQAGLSLAVHAIGDAANRVCLNAFAQIRKYEQENHLPPLRHRIEHVQILHPNDLNRLAEESVIASMQPIHALSDMEMADRYWGSRSQFAYAWRSLLDRKTRLLFGSDAPVENPNPFLGIHAAVSRLRLDGTPLPDGWYPQQSLSLQQALEAYTIQPAFAANLERVQGQLAPGFYADLLVLDEDPFSIPSRLIPSLKPVATMIDGNWAWKNPKMENVL